MTERLVYDLATGETRSEPLTDEEEAHLEQLAVDEQAATDAEQQRLTSVRETIETVASAEVWLDARDALVQWMRGTKP